ncbi:hypothetical protein C0J52_26039, partial [Blattella germanica]
ATCNYVSFLHGHVITRSLYTEAAISSEGIKEASKLNINVVQLRSYVNLNLLLELMAQIMGAFQERFNKAPPRKATLLVRERRAFAFGSGRQAEEWKEEDTIRGLKTGILWPTAMNAYYTNSLFQRGGGLAFAGGVNICKMLNSLLCILVFPGSTERCYAKVFVRDVRPLEAGLSSTLGNISEPLYMLGRLPPSHSSNISVVSVFSLAYLQLSKYDRSSSQRVTATYEHNNKCLRRQDQRLCLLMNSCGKSPMETLRHEYSRYRLHANACVNEAPKTIKVHGVSDKITKLRVSETKDGVSERQS